MPANDPRRYLEWLREQTADGKPQDDLEDALTHPRLAIEGAAGNESSAFLRYVANLWAAGLLDARTYTLLFPVYIRAAELAAHIGREGSPVPRESPAWVVDFLAARGRECDWGLDAEFWRQRLEAGFLFLDALDDSPRWMVRLVENAAAAWPLSRFVVATRPGGNNLPGFHRVRAGDTTLHSKFFSSSVLPEPL